MLLFTLLFFASQAPLPAAALTPAGVRCSQTPGMVLVEGICVSEADNIIVDGSLPQPRATPVPRRKRNSPRISMHCSPRMDIAAFRPVIVSASMRIMDPNEKFWCPEVLWNINGEFYGKHEGDCKPYETIVAEEGEPEVWPEGGETKRFEFWPGTYIITVKLLKTGSILAQQSCTVHIR